MTLVWLLGTQICFQSRNPHKYKLIGRPWGFHSDMDNMKNPSLAVIWCVKDYPTLHPHPCILGQLWCFIIVDNNIFSISWNTSWKLNGGNIADISSSNLTPWYWYWSIDMLNRYAPLNLRIFSLVESKSCPEVTFYPIKLFPKFFKLYEETSVMLILPYHFKNGVFKYATNCCLWELH